MRENSLNPAILIPNPSHACSAHSASITFRKSENSSLLWVLKDIGQLDRFIPRKPAVVKPAEKLESETIISVHIYNTRPAFNITVYTGAIQQSTSLGLRRPLLLTLIAELSLSIFKRMKLSDFTADARWMHVVDSDAWESD